MNHLVLTACISELGSVRYTPSGTPALDLRLEHESQVVESGESRMVKVAVKSLALGAAAETLRRLPLGSVWRFTGFLASPRNSKAVVFHIQEFQQD